MDSSPDSGFARNMDDEPTRDLQERVTFLEAELLRLKSEHQLLLAAEQARVEGLRHEIAARRQAETHLQAVVSSAPVVLWAMDAEGNVQIQEGLGLKELGIQPGQAVGSNVFQTHTAYPELLSYMHRALHGEQISVQIHPTMNPTRTFETHYSPRTLPDGSIGGVIAVSTDITARVEAEKALRRANAELEARVMERTAELDEANRLLQAVFGAAPAGLAVLRAPDFVFTSANPAYRAMTPHPEVDPIGRTFARIWPVEEGFVRSENLLQEIVTGSIQNRSSNFAITFPDGVLRHFDYSIHSLEVAGDKALLLVLWETTELELARQRAQQAAEQAMQTAAELEHLNREMQDFAFFSSHDLQEPLRKIQAFSERLAERYKSIHDEEGQDYLRRIQNATRRMQQMIQALLSYSRVTTQGQPFEPVNLRQAAEEALSNLEARLEDTGGTVLMEDLPTISGDLLQMRQLFQNLIGNSLKFHRDGVAPLVRVYELFEDTPGERQSQRAARDKICLVVEDNGIGFEPAQVERLFIPFSRLEGRTRYEGSGIGLALCRKIVERHGGTITAQAQPGQGARFIITLPRK